MEFKRQALGIINPESVLQRGYSIVYDENGEILNSVENIKEGDSLKIRLFDGTVVSEVREVSNDN